jgi:hypothetical protein
MITFSNPRLKAVFDNWPMGGNKRGVATFAVEKHPTRGFRVGRTTTGKTKYDTYGGKAAIVDGDNGRTYILQLTGYGFIKVSRSDFMSAEPELKSAFPDDPNFPIYAALIEEANKEVAAA